MSETPTERIRRELAEIEHYNKIVHESLKKTIEEMRRQGKEWSEVEDYITRQVGYNKEILKIARIIYYWKR